METGEELVVVAVNHAPGADAGDSFLNVQRKDGGHVIIPEKNVALIPPEPPPETPPSDHAKR